MSTTPEEAVTSNTVEDQIVAFGQNKPNGFKFEDFQTETPSIQQQDFVSGINKLLSRGLLELLKKNDEIYYRTKNAQQNPIAKGLDNEEKVVYLIIEQGGNKGIWSRDIRMKSNLREVQANKVLKSLESKKLIKLVKSVSSGKKKMYMLYNLEPDKSVTGGAWYQDQDFESEFVDLLNQQCYRYLVQRRDDAQSVSGSPLAIRNKSYASTQEIHKYISDSRISNVELSINDIDGILYTVVLDGKAEKKIGSDGTKLYRAINKLLPPPSFVTTPCGICPVIKRCSDIGSVTPKSCDYMGEWLKTTEIVESMQF